MAATGLSGLSGLSPLVSPGPGFNLETDIAWDALWMLDIAANNTLVSGRFSQVDDATGNGNHMTQAVANNRPLKVNALTNQAELAFFDDLRGDMMSAGDVAAFDVGLGNYSAFCTVLATTTVGAGVFMKSLASGGTAGIYFAHDNGTTAYYYFVAGTGFVFIGDSGDNTTHSLGVIRRGIGAGLTEIYYDGNLVTTTNDQGNHSNTEPVVLGSTSDSLSFMDGFLFSAGFISTDISAADMKGTLKQAMQRYAT